jgi:hypothetical protein
MPELSIGSKSAMSTLNPARTGDLQNDAIRNDAVRSDAPVALTLIVRTSDGKDHTFVQHNPAASYRLLEGLDLTKTFSNPLLQIGGLTGFTIFPTAQIVRLELRAAVNLETQWPAGMMLVREVTEQQALQAQERLRLDIEMGNLPRRDSAAISELHLTGDERLLIEIIPDASREAAELGPRTTLDQPFFHNRVFGASGTPIVGANGNLIILNPAHILWAVVYAPADVHTTTLLEMTAV